MNDHPDEPRELDFETMPPSTAFSIREIAEMSIDGTPGFSDMLSDYFERHEGTPDLQICDELQREERRVLKERRCAGIGIAPFRCDEGRVEHHNLRDPLGGTLKIKEWRALREAFGGRCPYCEGPCPRPVLEHVRPLSLGGRTNADNVLPACFKCNKDKGTKPLHEWQTDHVWWVAFLGRLAVAAERYDAITARKGRR